MRTKKQKQAGFSLIELLIVLAIIGVLASVVSLAVNSARLKGRDTKRVGDIRQSITAMEQYYIQHAAYPTGTASVASAGNGAVFSDPAAMDSAAESFTPNFLPIMPQSPLPADGPCVSDPGPGNNSYWYQVADDGSSYTLTFCLGGNTDNWKSGPHSATQDGVQ